MNIANNRERAVRLFPERPAIVFGDRTLTYRDLDRAVNRAGHGLKALEVAPGDRVALSRTSRSSPSRTWPRRRSARSRSR